MQLTTTYSIVDLTVEFYRVFDLFNKQFFENKLEQPILLVHTKRKAYGTFWGKSWINRETALDTKNEITINPEYLNRPTEEIMATLLHEMVHLYNHLHDIQDTSNNAVYHNKKFKEEAESRGLIIEYAKTIGWSVTKLQDSTKELIKTFKINEELFTYYRRSKSLGQDKVKLIRNKYQCKCGNKLSSTKDLNIICGDCKTPYEKVN